MAQLERNSDNFRPRRSAILPQTGDAKAATKDVEPVIAPLQISTPWTVRPTPSPGKHQRHAIGLRKLNDPVMNKLDAHHAAQSEPAPTGVIRDDDVLVNRSCAVMVDGSLARGKVC